MLAQADDKGDVCIESTAASTLIVDKVAEFDLFSYQDISLKPVRIYDTRLERK